MGQQCNESGGRVVVATGSVLMSGVAAFRYFDDSLRSFSRGNVEEVVVDFSECIYIDSHAIALIISASRRLRLSGAKLVIQNANQEISELLHAIQIDRIIEFV